ncbi:hypothetical protein GGR56DRAFT_589028 [Xylariaceae sp. FL0804]|nr:hypothetical protein GGR56DRAFT_589028 [Xylariaceae sp. FL0804]
MLRIFRVVLPVFVSLLAAAPGRVLAVNFTDYLPACATPCVESALNNRTSSVCAPSNSTCICNNLLGIGRAANDCISPSCTDEFGSAELAQDRVLTGWTDFCRAVSDPDALSTGAKAGIGVGASVGGLAVLGGLAFLGLRLLRVRREKRRRDGGGGNRQQQRPADGGEDGRGRSYDKSDDDDDDDNWTGSGGGGGGNDFGGDGDIPLLIDAGAKFIKSELLRDGWMAGRTATSSPPKVELATYERPGELWPGEHQVASELPAHELPAELSAEEPEQLPAATEAEEEGGEGDGG